MNANNPQCLRVLGSFFHERDEIFARSIDPGAHNHSHVPSRWSALTVRGLAGSQSGVPADTEAHQNAGSLLPRAPIFIGDSCATPCTTSKWKTITLT